LDIAHYNLVDVHYYEKIAVAVSSCPHGACTVCTASRNSPTASICSYDMTFDLLKGSPASQELCGYIELHRVEPGLMANLVVAARRPCQ